MSDGSCFSDLFLQFSHVSRFHVRLHNVVGTISFCIKTSYKLVTVIMEENKKESEKRLVW